MSGSIRFPHSEPGCEFLPHPGDKIIQMRIPEGSHQGQVVGCHSLLESLLLSLLCSTQSYNSSTVMTTTDSCWPRVMSPLRVYSAKCILLSFHRMHKVLLGLSHFTQESTNREAESLPRVSLPPGRGPGLKCHITSQNHICHSSAYWGGCCDHVESLQNGVIL